MRFAIVKQRYVPGYTWRSHRWDNPKSVIGDFMLRSKNFGLLFHTEGDVWVVEDWPYTSHMHQRLKDHQPAALDALRTAQEAVPIDAVPWDEYDVVISVDPILPRYLFRKYPRVLWTYYAGEHKCGDWTGDKPRYGYDLFLDHTFDGMAPEGNKSNKLPAVAHWPMVASAKSFQSVVSYKQRGQRLFLDSHGIRHIQDLDAYRAKLEEQFGMEVTHPQPWDFSRSFMAVAQRQMWSTRRYLQEVARCRYAWIPRQDEYIGQAAPEAAALGCIVLADYRATYPAMLCHPVTLMIDGSDTEEAARIVQALEDNEQLRRDARAYQDKRLLEHFQRRPLDVLGHYVRVKRGEI